MPINFTSKPICFIPNYNKMITLRSVIIRYALRYALIHSHYYFHVDG